jgi:hypothetical protein
VVAVVLVVLTVAGLATTAWWAAGGDDTGSTPADADPSPAKPSATATPTASTPATTPTGSPTRSSTASTTGPPPPTFTVTARPGTPAGSQAQTQPPDAVTLPSGTSVPVRVASTSAAGLLQVPDDISVAGWWDGGARLGDSYGTMVVASHVDSTTQGIGPFAELLEMSAGDRVTVTSTGLTQRFAVDTVDLVPKTELETSDALFSTQGATRLVLITCAGRFDPDRGGYQDLAVVTAAPTGPATSG